MAMIDDTEYTRLLDAQTISFRFEPDPVQDDHYERFMKEFEKSDRTTIQFRFPVRLWKRIVFWLLGMRPFPPSNHTLTGEIQDAVMEIDQEVQQ